MLHYYNMQCIKFQGIKLWDYLAIWVVPNVFICWAELVVRADMSCVLPVINCFLKLEIWNSFQQLWSMFDDSSRYKVILCPFTFCNKRAVFFTFSQITVLALCFLINWTLLLLQRNKCVFFLFCVQVMETEDACYCIN